MKYYLARYGAHMPTIRYLHIADVADYGDVLIQGPTGRPASFDSAEEAYHWFALHRVRPS